MKILALEFSSLQRGVAAFDPATGSIAEVTDATGGPTMKPFALIESALQQAKMQREEIEVVAIGIGPGSYTGIRAALSLAQGWQLARGVGLCGISSAQCLATQKAIEGSCKFNVVIDAQRGEFYLATYESLSGRAKAVSPLRIVPPETVRARKEAGEVLIGPEITRWFPEGQPMFPCAATLARLAATGAADPVSGEKLQPIYLREIAFVKTPVCLG